MSAIAVASAGARSGLNPNAPLFIPAAYQQVEDFSPEWWELVKTTGWFRDHWFQQHQDQESFEGEDDDIVGLLPDSFDLEFPDLDLEAEAFGSADPIMKGLKESGVGSDAEAVVRNLSVRSPRNGAPPAKYWEKPARCGSPNFSPRRIIQQPR